MSAQPVQENGVGDFGDEGKLDDAAEVLTINPDDFPGTEAIWEAELRKVGHRATIDVGRAVRRARYQFQTHPEAFQDVLTVIAKITSGGETVTWHKNAVIERYQRAIEEAHRRWSEGYEVACPLTRAEMIGSRFCHPRGAILPDVMYKLRLMGFSQFFNVLPPTRFGRFEVDGIISRRETSRGKKAIGRGANEGAFHDISSILFDKSASGAKVTGDKVNRVIEPAPTKKITKSKRDKSYRKDGVLQRKLDKWKRKNSELKHKNTELKRENDELNSRRSQRKRKSSEVDGKLSELEGTFKRRASELHSAFSELESKADFLQSQFDQLRQ
ncbi:hypothetical protein QBC40DRAFT_268674 [Triangularia verruculosa]|uniref:Uncharacterized protein n=1 Tax=Triangularia verruculosa TaxID=2587418 RepID=A0AAN6X8Y9_9PEZI|nr:hypothetical protein QBC40DRAFT_268674 [Triangularia verruculosa]